MPWMEVDKVSLRREFVLSARVEGANIRKLCREYSISSSTAYKWLGRYAEGGIEGLHDLSRRPLRSPRRTDCKVEKAVLEVRDAHPAWGGRKIKARLSALGYAVLPSPSTITEILRRHGRLCPEESLKRRPFTRFEYATPNELWQIDFKGHFQAGRSRCHPLSVIDDHSRFATAVTACGDQRFRTVKQSLTVTFQRYGLPFKMLMDNGTPWGYMKEHPHTSLTVWLMRLGIRVLHGRPYHPQTQGKTERFNRTLGDELIRWKNFGSLKECQREFNRFREVYNNERPHEALEMAVPANRYRPSERMFPKTLPPVVYDHGVEVRVVDHAKISYRGRCYRVGKAFHGLPVAIRHSENDGILNVYFLNHKIREIDLKRKNEDD